MLYLQNILGSTQEHGRFFSSNFGSIWKYTWKYTYSENISGGTPGASFVTVVSPKFSDTQILFVLGLSEGAHHIGPHTYPLSICTYFFQFSSLKYPAGFFSKFELNFLPVKFKFEISS